MRDLTNDVTRKGQLEGLFTEQTEGPMTDARMTVSIVLESHEQFAFMQPASDLLCALEISHEVVIMSNYTQEQVVEFIRIAQLRGLKVIIAGGAPDSGFLGLITSNTLLPVLEVAISTPLVGEHPSASEAGEVATSTKDLGSQAKCSAHKAARTAAAIAALDDCHISDRLRRWQETHANKSDAELAGK